MSCVCLSPSRLPVFFLFCVCPCARVFLPRPARVLHFSVPARFSVALPLSRRVTSTASPMEDIRVDTSMGSFTVELYLQQAPKACQNFTELSRRGYYDGVVFHRIIKDFMLQGGDPTGTGRGGESIFGGKFEVIAPPPHARTRTRPHAISAPPVRWAARLRSARRVNGPQTSAVGAAGGRPRTEASRQSAPSVTPSPTPPPPPPARLRMS